MEEVEDPSVGDAEGGPIPEDEASFCVDLPTCKKKAKPCERFRGSLDLHGVEDAIGRMRSD